ncbi:GGDEF domain-containing protein [Cellvibrio mixtus]|uniref:GGDEF domain-containing protein n=1 Tax=Cellvibrio mixtus TaxID=39650 RepID=UPI0005866F7B|nr:GGDEF domain-containing protein [Cellvibrio mixtus]
MTMAIQQEITKARLLGLLILITLLLLLLQYYGPQKTLVLGTDAGVRIETIDDRGNGGASIAHLTRDGERFILDCDIVASSYTWPYCEISFILTDDVTGRGIDLSTFTEVELHIHYSQPQDFGIRFQLVNFNPAYANPGDTNSQKYNAIELYDTHIRYPQLIELSHMQVPTWWLSQGKIPPDYWGPEFDDVRGVQIATGERVTPGKYQMIIEHVEFRGKYISDHQLLLVLVSIWTALGLIYFVNTLRKAKLELQSNKQRQMQLESLNKLLNQEQQKLEERLARDPLTGVLNREGLAPVFQQLNPDGTQALLSLIFIDIDHFKRINDQYGHNVGDQVLLVFAQSLSANTRGHDLLARWGGEEFVLACPDTNIENALGLAEKLRRCIEETEWPKGLKVTASFGVAQQMEGESPTDFIGRADKALYVAKAQGRNCVRSSQQPPAQLIAVK